MISRSFHDENHLMENDPDCIWIDKSQALRTEQVDIRISSPTTFLLRDLADTNAGRTPDPMET